MNSGYRITVGKYGENLAKNFLIKRGIEIIDQNYYTRYGEIDLIGKQSVSGGGQSDEILFFEVKTRTNSNFGYPEEAVGRQKISSLVSAIRIYLDENRLDNFWRLDVISVEIDKMKKIARIKWFKNLE